MVFDLVIIGSGIAGSAALISLQSCGLNIAVVASLIQPSFKIGETLSSAAHFELESLGIFQEFLEEEQQTAYSKFSSWGSGILREENAWYAGKNFGWYINRLSFESFLWKHASATHFKHYKRKVISCEFKNQHWSLLLDDHSILKAKQLIDCSGRAAVVMRNRTIRIQMDKLVCCYSVLEQSSKEVLPTFGTLVDPVENGWIYSTILPDLRMVVAYFTDHDLLGKDVCQYLPKWQSIVSESSFTIKRIDSANYSMQSRPRITDAATRITKPVMTNGLIAAGDAVATFDPLSSQGMTTALWAGRRSAQAIMSLMQSGDFTALEKYSQDYQQGIASYIGNYKKVYGEEQRFNHALFWKRRAAFDPTSFLSTMM